MKKDILWRTNVFLSLAILLGFSAVTFIDYDLSRGLFEKDVERVSSLTSEGIHYRIDALFAGPLNVALTMANDRLLREFLQNETGSPGEVAFVQGVSGYLMGYRKKYRYASVFLVSARTGRYYHFNGVDRIMTPGHPENEWYHRFLQSDEEYELNIDNDEASNDDVTVFVNCRIRDRDGSTMGVVGVGFRVDTLQTLLQEYEHGFGIRALLLDESGGIEVSTERSGYGEVFDDKRYPGLREKLRESGEKPGGYWYRANKENGYLVYRYISALQWHLIVDSDTAELDRARGKQLLHGIVVTAMVTAFVLFTVMNIVRKYNARIVRLTMAREQGRRNRFQKETAKLYENIYELDITHNRAGNEATAKYFESLGLPGNCSLDQAFLRITGTQIKEEFRGEYVDTFAPSRVREAFARGDDSLCCDLMQAALGEEYHWVRITARIFYWEEDRSIRMLAYHQNIDEEKRQEQRMVEKMHHDALTGLYNKAATQHKIDELLANNPTQAYAFFILDIDEFKRVNDTCGHAVGDLVIADFARKLKSHFRAGDVVGRIGGDEFAAFVEAPSRAWVEGRAEKLVASLHYRFESGGKSCPVSVSIGVALTSGGDAAFGTLYRNADIALYRAKKDGRNGYRIYAAE